MTGHAEMKAEWGLINQRLNHSGLLQKQSQNSTLLFIFLL